MKYYYKCINQDIDFPFTKGKVYYDIGEGKAIYGIVRKKGTKSYAFINDKGKEQRFQTLSYYGKLFVPYNNYNFITMYNRLVSLFN